MSVDLIPKGMARYIGHAQIITPVFFFFLRVSLGLGFTTEFGIGSTKKDKIGFRSAQR